MNFNKIKSDIYISLYFPKMVYIYLFLLCLYFYFLQIKYNNFFFFLNL
jgi:hypothetical protein